MAIGIEGGEPFIRDDLARLIAGIVRNRMRFSIVSNGGLIDDEIAAFIAKTGRCDYIQVSVDGSRSEIHDILRGRGAFNSAVLGIKTLLRQGVSVTARVTVHRHNVDDLKNTVRFLLEDLQLPIISTNAAGYLGTCREHSHEVLLSVRERERAMQTLLKLSQEYPGRIRSTAGPLAEARTWHQMEEARVNGNAPFSNGGYLTGCGCTFSKITVRSDGMFVPCNFLAHMELGRINEDALLEIWQHSPELSRLRQRRLIPLKAFDFCAGCSFIPYCTGNCPGLAYSMIGQVDHPSPHSCLNKYLRQGGHLATEN